MGIPRIGHPDPTLRYTKRPSRAKPKPIPDPLATSNGNSGSTPPPRAEPRIIIRPQPGPQERFLSTAADIAIYGGAAGGGKTWGLLLEPLRHIITTKDYGALIFRRTSKQVTNEGAMWDESFNIYPHLGGISNRGQLEWLFPPFENRIRFSHMEHEKNMYDWQGSQIPYIGWDELTHFTESQFFYLLGRNRFLGGVKPYMRATTNPDADSWVAKFIAWWIDQDTGFPIIAREGQLRWFVRVENTLEWADSPADLVRRFPDLPEEALPKSVTFIPAKVRDNAILMAKDPGYLANLYAQTAVERARLLDGNWKIRPASGLVFNRTWFRFLDTPPYEVMARVRYWDKAGTADAGAYTAGVLMSRTYDGHYVIEDVVRAQLSSWDRERLIRATAELDGKDVAIWVEQEPGSGGKESAENTIRMLAGWTVRADRPTGDKVIRADHLSAQAEARNVILIRANWNAAFLDEADGFPEGKYKDQVDAAAGAFNKLAAIVMVDDFDPRELSGVIPDDEYGGTV